MNVMNLELRQLKRLPLFQTLCDRDLDAIADRATVRVFPKGALLINEGDEPRSVYCVIEGRVRSFVSNTQGKELTLKTHGAGDCFGAAELLGETPSCASVVTLERCKLLTLPATGSLKSLLLEHSDLRARLVTELSSQISTLVGIAKKLALMDVYQRVATTLVDLARWENGHLTVALRLTHQDIASRIGASREMVTHVLKDLVTSQYLRVEDRRIIINRPLPAIR